MYQPRLGSILRNLHICARTCAKAALTCLSCLPLLSCQRRLYCSWSCANDFLVFIAFHFRVSHFTFPPSRSASTSHAAAQIIIIMNDIVLLCFLSCHYCLFSLIFSASSKVATSVFMASLRVQPQSVCISLQSAFALYPLRCAANCGAWVDMYSCGVIVVCFFG